MDLLFFLAANRQRAHCCGSPRPWYTAPIIPWVRGIGFCYGRNRMSMPRIPIFPWVCTGSWTREATEVSCIVWCLFLLQTKWSTFWCCSATNPYDVVTNMCMLSIVFSYFCYLYVCTLHATIRTSLLYLLTTHAAYMPGVCYYFQVKYYIFLYWTSLPNGHWCGGSCLNHSILSSRLVQHTPHTYKI